MPCTVKQGNVIALRTEVATAVTAALQLNVAESQKVQAGAHHGIQRGGSGQSAYRDA